MSLAHLSLTLKRILVERGITQKELAERTGLREATISEFVNNSRSTINKDQLLTIMKALDIKDLSRIIEVHWD